MAKLPDETAFGRRPVPRPAPAARGPRVLPSEGLVEQAQSLTRVGELITRTAQEWQRRDDQRSLLAAESRFLSEKIIADNSFDDSEYQTYAARYAERVTQSRNEAAQLIKSNDLRQRFLMESQLEILKGTALITEQAKKKEKDIARSDLNQLIDTASQDLSMAKDESTRIRILNHIGNAIANTEGNGHISSQEAQALRVSSSASYAKIRLIGTEPEEALIALRAAQKGEKNWASFLPPADRVKSLAELEAAVRAKQVAAAIHTEVLRLSQKHPGDLGSQVKEARNIRDIDVQKGVVDGITKEFQLQETIEKEEKENIHDRLATKIAIEGASFYDPAFVSDLSKLSKDQRSSLLDLHEMKHGTKKLSDGEKAVLFDEFTRDIAQNSRNILSDRWNPATLRTFLSESEAQKWIEIRNNTRLDPSKIHIPATDGQKGTLIESTLDAVGLHATDSVNRKQKRALFKQAFELELEAERQRQVGKELSFSQMTDIAERLSTEYVFNPPGFLSKRTELRLFEFTGDERFLDMDVRVDGRRIPREDLQRVLEIIEEKRPGELPTPELVEKIYRAWILNLRGSERAHPRRNF